MIKKIIIIIMTISFGILNTVSAKTLVNPRSKLDFEIADKNMVIKMSNINHEISGIASIGKRKKLVNLNVVKHNDHYMIQIPENVSSIEIRNESTKEFFTIEFN